VDIQVNTSVTGDQTVARVAIQQDGGFFVIWRSSHGGTPQIYGQRISSTGARLGSEIPVSNNLANSETNESRYDVVALTDGGYAVLFSDASNRLRSQRYAADGTASGTLLIVHDPALGNGSGHAAVRAAALPNGGYAVSSMVLNSLDESILVRVYDGSGAAVGPEFTALRQGGIGFARPHIASNASGAMVVAYVLGNTTTDVYALRLSTTAAVGAPIHMANFSSGIQNNARIALASDGSFVATWSSDHTGSGRIYLRRFDPAGAPIGDEVLVSPFNSGMNMPEIGMDATGAFAILWSGAGGPGSDAWSNVYARRFLANGTPAGDVVLVNAYNPSLTDQELGVMAMNAQGQCVGAWTDRVQEWRPSGGASTGHGVFANRF
jgi:hypothetical protein